MLNNSPLKMEDLGDLPIKTVNGAMVYVTTSRRCATAIRRRPTSSMSTANRSVLMMVLKAGSISTLDIIAGIKRKVIEVRDSLPRRAQDRFIGDQSIFVRGAITGVAYEGIIAALLTSVMILLFLGSWRSTVIIATSIPLAVLGAIIMLSMIGETLNIMTLGGLALAVGILVDDATVTIENINYHLEQGKTGRAIDLDGANQIVTPAFVSLLCICIVFVPDGSSCRVWLASCLSQWPSGDVRNDMVIHPVAHIGADNGQIFAAAASPRRKAKRRGARAIRWYCSNGPSKRVSSVVRGFYRELLTMRCNGGRSLSPASSASSLFPSCWCRS